MLLIIYQTEKAAKTQNNEGVKIKKIRENSFK